MKKIFVILALLVNSAYAYDWSFADLEDCSSYDAESFDSSTDFTIKCLDDNESAVFLEDYLELNN